MDYKDIIKNKRLSKTQLDKETALANDVSEISKTLKSPLEVVVENIDFNKLSDAISSISKIKGETGVKGQKGDKGDRGTDGKSGKNGKDGKNGVDGKDGLDGIDGITPIKGIDYFDGINGKDGKKGAAGKDGLDGKSAYEIAVDKGFIGSEAEWIKSLKGRDGVNTFTTNGKNPYGTVGYGSVTEAEKTTWNAKEDTSNKVTSLSGASTDVQYPSAKLVYDQLAGKQALLGYTPVNKAGDTMLGTLNSQSILPSATATYNLGDATHYYANSYTARRYFNSTTYIDGSTEGRIKMVSTAGSETPFLLDSNTTNPETLTVVNRANADCAFVLKTEGISKAAYINLFSTSTAYNGFSGWVSGVKKFHVGRFGIGGGCSIYTSDGGTGVSIALYCNDTQDTKLYGDLTMTEAKNMILGTTTGTKIGTATNQKLAFFNATPIVQPSGTPANATDLATALTLINDLKSKLVTIGLIA